GGLQRANRSLAARAGSLDEDLDLLQPVLHSLARARVRGHLGGERRRLARALEAGRAGGLPRDNRALAVGEGDDRVVEGGLDVRLADRDVLLHAAARTTSRRLSSRRCHGLGLGRSLLAAADGLLRALASARVRLRALAANGEAAPVADPAVRAD